MASDKSTVEVKDAASGNVKFTNERLTWGLDEESAWRDKFRAAVEPFWSRHGLRCTRPGWDAVNARVAVHVDDQTSSQGGVTIFIAETDD